MKREEAVNKWVIPAIKNTWNEKKCAEIIQALDQEPCDDAIGRLDMLDAIGHGTTYTSEELQKIIKALPPVNPTSNVSIQITEREKYGRFN